MKNQLKHINIIFFLVVILLVNSCSVISASRSLKKAYHSYNNKEYEEAIKYFTKVIDSIPEWSVKEDPYGDAMLYQSRGLSYFKINNFQNALLDLTKAYELFKKAEKMPKQTIIFQYPNCGDSNLYLPGFISYTSLWIGACYFEMKNYDQALIYLDISLSYDKKNYLAYRYLGAVYYQTGDNEKAKINFNKSLEINSDEENKNFLKKYPL